jgi:transposase
VQPVGPVQHGFDWFDIYGAVEPITGERFFLAIPSLHADMVQLFVDAFAHAFPRSLNILLLDRRGAHTASRLTLPAHVRLLFVPPYGPELSPIERVWRDVKDDLAWQQCTDLDAPQGGLSTLLQAYEADTLQSLGLSVLPGGHLCTACIAR